MPLVLGRPANIWLGIILLLLITIQITLGIMMVRGRMNLLGAHKVNAALIAVVSAFHAYWGLGIWFFNFTIK